MRKFKTVTALCVAFATMVSANSSLTASAATVDPELAQREAFVAEYSNEDDQNMAQYCLDNGLTVEEARNFMNSYISIKAEKSNSQISNKKRLKAGKNGTANERENTGKSYYNGNKASKNQHEAIVIVKNGSGTYSTGLTLSYTPEWINVADPVPFEVFNGYKNLQIKNNNNSISINGYLPAKTTEEIPLGVVQIPFNVTEPNTPGHEKYAETTIYSKFDFKRNYNMAILNTDSVYGYETYVKGDVNHDGQVDEKDRDYLIKYNVNGGIVPRFHYTNQSDEIADIITPLAMDFNCDGVIDMTDAIWVIKCKD